MIFANSCPSSLRPHFKPIQIHLQPPTLLLSACQSPLAGFTALFLRHLKVEVKEELIQYDSFGGKPLPQLQIGQVRISEDEMIQLCMDIGKLQLKERHLVQTYLSLYHAARYFVFCSQSADPHFLNNRHWLVASPLNRLFNFLNVSQVRQELELKGISSEEESVLVFSKALSKLLESVKRDWIWNKLAVYIIDWIVKVLPDSPLNAQICKSLGPGLERLQIERWREDMQQDGQKWVWVQNQQEASDQTHDQWLKLVLFGSAVIMTLSYFR